MTKLSDLDLDIPSLESTNIRENLLRGCVASEKGTTLHPAGIYFYKSIPAFNNISVIDYKKMELMKYQKVDILNNTFLDGIDKESFEQYLTLIEDECIDWGALWEYENPYQLSNYPGIVCDFKAESVMDLAIILAIIRPGALQNYDKMKAYMHTYTLLKNKTMDQHQILKETYGVAVFDEQFKKLGKDDGKYRYKKQHAIGYAYVLLLDFLKNCLK